MLHAAFIMNENLIGITVNKAKYTKAQKNKGHISNPHRKLMCIIKFMHMAFKISMI